MHRLFSRYFLYLLLVNLLLLANLEERSTYRELDCFLRVGNNILEGVDLVGEVTGNMFALFWEATILLAKEVLFCF